MRVDMCSLRYRIQLFLAGCVAMFDVMPAVSSVQMKRCNGLVEGFVDEPFLLELIHALHVATVAAQRPIQSIVAMGSCRTKSVLTRTTLDVSNSSQQGFVELLDRIRSGNDYPSQVIISDSRGLPLRQYSRNSLLALTTGLDEVAKQCMVACGRSGLCVELLSNYPLRGDEIAEAMSGLISEYHAAIASAYDDQGKEVAACNFCRQAQWLQPYSEANQLLFGRVVPELLFKQNALPWTQSSPRLIKLNQTMSELVPVLVDEAKPEPVLSSV